MRVDIVHLAGFYLRVAQGALHCQRDAARLRVRLHHVVRVGRLAVAYDLRIDPRAAAARVLELLDDHSAGAFGDHEAVAVLVERTAGGRGRVVARGQGAHGAEARYGERRDGRFRAAA